MELILLPILLLILLYAAMKQKENVRIAFISAYMVIAILLFGVLLFVNKDIIFLCRPFVIAGVITGVYTIKTDLKVSTLRLIVFLLLLLFGLSTMALDLFALSYFKKNIGFSNGSLLDFCIALIFGVMTISRVFLDREFYKPLGVLKVVCIFIFSCLVFWTSGKILDRVRLYSHENTTKAVLYNNSH